MKTMRFTHALATLALWSILCLSAFAQTAVEHPAGFRTVIPASYTVHQEASGIAATNSAGTGLAIKSHNYRNLEAFIADLDLAEEGFSLVDEPRLLERGDGIYFRASKPNPQGGAIVADMFVTFLPEGGGAVVVALSQLSEADAGYYAAYDVTANLQFFQPQATAASSAWDSALRGKHLLYLYTGNGYSERKDIFLFSNGTFVQRVNMSSSSMSGHGAVGGAVDGVWKVTQAGQLVMSFYDGRSASYALTSRQASNEVGLNGQRYFILAD